MSDETVLVLSGAGVPQWAGRGISQTFASIDAATQLERDVNGVLVDLSFSGFKKFKTTIRCTDMRVALPDYVFPGATFTMDCVGEFFYPTSGSASRTIVPGSDRVEGTNTFYRPRLSVTLVGSPTTETDEYGGAVAWSADFEET